MSYRIVKTDITYTLKGDQDAQDYEEDNEEEFECQLDNGKLDKEIEPSFKEDNRISRYIYNANTTHGNIQWCVDVSSGMNGVEIDSYIIECPENIRIIEGPDFSIQEV